MTSAGPLVVLGDALLDVDLLGAARRLAPDAPVPVVEDIVEAARPGGAGLAALLAAADGRDVVLVTALGTDEYAERLLELLPAGVAVVAVPVKGSTPRKVRVRVAGQSLLRLDHGCSPGALGALPAAAGRALRSAGALLVADYGRGVAAHAEVRAALQARIPGTPLVWDPHPRGADPVPGVTLATPNLAEATGFAGLPVRPSPDGLGTAAAAASELVHRWGAGAVAVTLGRRGALLSFGVAGSPLVVPAPAVAAGDTCGAGDRFAATAAGLLLDGAVVSEALVAAVAAASAFVAAGGAAGLALGPGASRRPAGGGPPYAVEATNSTLPPWTEAAQTVERTRAGGGTVVATGGCFDLLHAGHAAMLEAARRLGDCLVVCLNSDASVRRLKGPGRPLVPQQDRAAVLRSLRCVDAVAVFDEPTPSEVLAALRPDVWAKGGDYADVEMPEAAVLAGWGGQAVLLPYLDGRSTTRLVAAALGRPPTKVKEEP